MINLIIDRERWARGDGWNQLLANNGTMCCLGFLALECGIPRARILNGTDPEEIPSSKWPDGLIKPSGEVYGDRLYTNGAICNSLITANDSSKLRPGEREKRITLHMRKLGVAVRFVDTKKEAVALKRELKKGKAK